MLSQIEQAIKSATADLGERDEVVRLSLLSVFTGEHIVLLGPPGTAKSLIARRIAGMFEGFRYFEYLLTKFTVPEEIFGPLSLKGLENDRFERKIDGFLPEAHIVFLDEIFKANSSILNSLLALINERIFYNGSMRIEVPLISMIGASNEVPVEGEGLEALYDRFLFRYIVKPIESEDDFLKKIIRTPDDSVELTVLKPELIESVRKDTSGVKLSPDLEYKILRLRQLLKSNDIYVSDRRWKKAIKVLKTLGVISGRNVVDTFDALVLKHLLWSKPQDMDTVFSLVKSVFLGVEDDVDTRKFLTKAASDFQKLKAQLSGSTWGRSLVCRNTEHCKNFEKNDDYIGGCKNFIPSINGGCLNFDSDKYETTWFSPAKSSFQYGSVKTKEKVRWRMNDNPAMKEFTKLHDALKGVYEKLKNSYESVKSAIDDLSMPHTHFFTSDIEEHRVSLESRMKELYESKNAAEALYKTVHGVYQQLKG